MVTPRLSSSWKGYVFRNFLTWSRMMSALPSGSSRSPAVAPSLILVLACACRAHQRALQKVHRHVGCTETLVNVHVMVHVDLKSSVSGLIAYDGSAGVWAALFVT